MPILRLLMLAASLMLVLVGPSFAHPHIWIDAKATLVFDDGGNLKAIRNAWTFDEGFSVWQIQGLDVDGDGITTSEEMQELADENLSGLAEYGFYSSLVRDGDEIGLSAVGDARFVHENNRSTLTFSVAPAEPVSGVFELAIADPEYYVAINFDGPNAVVLENAPAACTVRMQEGHEVSPELQGELGALPADVIELPPDLAAALRGAQGSIAVACPEATISATESAATAAPDTAADAAEQMARAAPSGDDLPFGGPPPEPGFILPDDGFLGWVKKSQEAFYLGINQALASLKSDWTGFWVLGGLSFLYGVFHAAGPGHGKVVIGSYMLANERQVRRGIVLSFLAAMMQSAVAIGFVGIAAAILGLSSAVMNDAIGWFDIVAYGLIMLLGLWLIVRHLLGWGHSHAHAAGGLLHDGQHGHEHHNIASHNGHDHAHDEHHHHHHVVTADQIKGDWREQVGVVLGVGIRPCSGALFVLGFALSQGILLAGVAAVFMMGLGTALTVSVLASLAVGAKGLAQRFAGADSPLVEQIFWWVELAGAVIVFGFGLVLFLAAI